jgi:hypothetical protein
MVDIVLSALGLRAPLRDLWQAHRVWLVTGLILLGRSVIAVPLSAVMAFWLARLSWTRRWSC